MCLRAAIFDLDGTLADSAELHAESWRLLAGELGLAMPDALFRRTFGRANASIIPELLGRPTDAAEVGRLSDRKEVLYRAIIPGRLRLFPGATALVEGLAAAGWRLGIGSSTPVANLAAVLPLLGLDGLVTEAVGMEDVARHKPEPDAFLEAARRLGVPPARCLVFEDAPAGIEAAHRAGMGPIAVLSHHPAEAFGLARAVRPGLGDITAEECAGWLRNGAA